jgi:hypothetical protein
MHCGFGYGEMPIPFTHPSKALRAWTVASRPFDAFGLKLRDER